jgi:hypothetical protein
MPSPSPNRHADIAGDLAELFRLQGWDVQAEPGEPPPRPDLIVEKGSLRYAVELKSVGEGRPDRVLALLSQAILQVRHHAERRGLRPLAIVQVGHASASLQRKIEEFHRRYASDVAIGLVSAAGSRHFIGAGLESLNAQAPRGGRKARLARPRKLSDLFSDLNQWMLKVLLAPELPGHLLNAPRGRYRSNAELAEAAQVSAMSASRFIQRLREDGFLDEESDVFRLVRRHELFRRWQSAAMRSSPELRMSYLIPAPGARSLHKLASRLEACMGLFSAADLLELGHVSGAVPYLYVRRLSPPQGSDWPGLVPSAPGEAPQVIIKQSNAPEALFRGAVRVGDVLVSDVLQVWLDVSAHPSRGAEQADVLRHGVLKDVLGSRE